MTSCRGIAAAFVLASIAFSSGEGRAADAEVTKLPRLQLLWSLEGLGRFDGSAAGNVYYTVANDGKTVQAIDVTQGRVVWRTPLPEPVSELAHVRIHDGTVLLAYRRTRWADAAIAALSSRDGKLAWSRNVSCPDPDLLGGGKKLILSCQREQPPARRDYQELDPATGQTLASVVADDDVQLAPNGNLCGASYGSTWCGRLARDRIDVAWTQPGARWTQLRLTADHVIEMGRDDLTVRRAGDGHVIWKKKDARSAALQERAGRVFFLGNDAVDVVALADGRALGRFPLSLKDGGHIIADGDVVIVERFDINAQSILVIDQQLRARSVAKNVPFLSRAVGDVLLSQSIGMSGVNREKAPLEAYSLSRFAAPEATLDAYHKVVAVLERRPFPYDAADALAELRSIPDAMASLERIIAKGPRGIESAAIAVAGLTGDPRFLPALGGRLASIADAREAVERWPLVVDVVQALAELRSADAAVTLLAFWNRVGTRIGNPWRRTVVKDLVANTVWKFAARQQLVRCDDMSFPLERADAGKALLGTASPGTAYVADAGRRWAAICEARQDDDGNGKLEVEIGIHGDPRGDHLRPYLVLGAGHGAEIDDFVASAADGRWVVTTREMCVHLVDTQTGAAVALKGADGRPGDPVLGDHRAAAFSPDGKSLLYIRSDGVRSMVVQRDLPTGTERVIDPGAGALSRTFFDRSGRFIVMELVVQDSDRDGVLTPPRVATTLGQRRCRGRAMVWSTYGQIGDRPVQRVAPVAGGPVRDAPAGPPLQPRDEPRSRHELVSQGANDGDGLPVGPMRWKRAERPARR